MENHPKIYMTKNELLTSTEAFDILQNPYVERISYVPPAGPRGGDVYLFSNGGDTWKVS